MADLSVNIAGVLLKNPVIAASGTFAFGEEAALYMDASALGAITLKALTREKRVGNLSPRIAETASGVLNSVGLQNPGVDTFLEKSYPRVRRINTVQIANIAGSVPEDYTYVAERLNDTDIALYEVNVSCPNVKTGGMSIGTDASAIESLVEQVKKVARKPVIVKLTPNVTSIVEMATAAKNGGADAISLINTLAGMAINPYNRRPVIANVTGGLSGPAIKPVALKMVHDVYSAGLGLPIIGMGGIMTGEDVAEFMIAGADAVMVGTATMHNPSAMIEIIEELNIFAETNAPVKISDITGTLITEG